EKKCPGRCTLKCGKHERPTLPYNCGKYICCVPVKVK
nr:Chain A, Defensin [Caretta caretta]